MQLKTMEAVSVVHQIRCDRCGKETERGELGFAEMTSSASTRAMTRFLGTEIGLRRIYVRPVCVTPWAHGSGSGHRPKRLWRPSWQHSSRRYMEGSSPPKSAGPG